MAEENQQTQQAPKFQIVGQYIKDLSFENPQAPKSLLQSEQKPKIDVNIDLNANKLRDDLYEVVFSVNVKASREETALFVIDLHYAGLFNIQNVPEKVLPQVLFVDCPFMLFPYLRRIVSDATRDGGFPPLMLEPIDFLGLFKKRLTEEAQKQAENAQVN